MKNLLPLSMLFVILIVMGCTQTPTTIGEMKFPEGSYQHVVHAEEIQWILCPPNLPAGCEMAILEGSPKNNDLFTVRFKLSEEFVMPPHTHPRDERATIIQGKAYVAFGKDGKRENAKEFGPGDYYVNARGAIHSVWVDSSTIIQLTGIGPWEADYVEKQQ